MYSFDGNGGYVEIDSPAFTAPANYSISLSFKTSPKSSPLTNVDDTGSVIMSIGGAMTEAALQPLPSILVWIDPSGYLVFKHSGPDGSIKLQSALNVANSRWHTVVVTRNLSREWSMLVDSVDRQNTIGISNDIVTAGAFYIGNKHVSDQYKNILPFNGCVGKLVLGGGKYKYKTKLMGDAVQGCSLGADVGPDPNILASSSIQCGGDETSYAFLPFGYFKPSFQFRIDLRIKTVATDGLIFMMGDAIDNESPWFNCILQKNVLLVLGNGKTKQFSMRVDGVINDGFEHVLSVERNGLFWVIRIDGVIITNSMSSISDGNLVPDANFYIGGRRLSNGRYNNIAACIKNVSINDKSVEYYYKSGKSLAACDAAQVAASNIPISASNRLAYKIVQY